MQNRIIIVKIGQYMCSDTVYEVGPPPRILFWPLPCCAGAFWLSSLGCLFPAPGLNDWAPGFIVAPPRCVPLPLPLIFDPPLGGWYAPPRPRILPPPLGMPDWVLLADCVGG
jgi:hypothetical protein